MSEYQYYEFLAVDRPLDEEDRDSLRELSSRARITSWSFTNSYEWGDFKGDPAALMERWFDLHLYLANWGEHRLMIRLPKRLVDRPVIEPFIRDDYPVLVRDAGENLILDIDREEVGFDWDDDDSGWLAALAPLRDDLLAGDLRPLYLLWLIGVEMDVFKDDEPEPLTGIAPLTPALEALADFFGIDADLVEAAAERSEETDAPSPKAVRQSIEAMADAEKTELLTRLAEGDRHVAAELRRAVRNRQGLNAEASARPARTVGELRSRAGEIRLAREREEAERAAAERRRLAEEAEKARRARIEAVARRGEGVWDEIETEIERRNPSGYDMAMELLADLRLIAEERGEGENFTRRLRSIRDRHARKKRFIERLVEMG
ncbi:hypothetical protein [Inquilinus sp. CAU 1745]|uniref:hypothetical protein n=1 Tax=Inquilinus sp. CAU 1745 TaxID=3140369 RepID=UPI00325BA57D